MAAPTLAGTTSTQVNSGLGTSITITTPSATAVGDLLVVTIMGRYLTSSSGDIDSPAGWTRITPQQRPASSGGDNSFAADQFVRIAAAAGANTHTFTIGAGFAAVSILKEVGASCFTLAGIQTASLPFSAALATDSRSTGGTTYTPPSLNVTRNNSLAISTRVQRAESSGAFNTANGWTSFGAVLGADPLQEIRSAYLVTDTNAALTMPVWNTGTAEVISFGWAVHGFPDGGWRIGSSRIGVDRPGF